MGYITATPAMQLILTISKIIFCGCVKSMTFWKSLRFRGNATQLMSHLIDEGMKVVKSDKDLKPCQSQPRNWG